MRTNWIVTGALALLVLGGCKQRTTTETVETPTTTSSTSTTVVTNMTPEELGQLGAEIKKKPAEAKRILSEHGLDEASSEKRRISGSGVATIGSPAARYSFSFAGMIAAVYGFNTYGSTPTSKRAMYRATSECGTGPTRRTFGRAASARTFAITGPTKTKFRSGASSAAAASSARSISFRKLPTKPITRPASRAK